MNNRKLTIEQRQVLDRIIKEELIREGLFSDVTKKVSNGVSNASKYMGNALAGLMVAGGIAGMQANASNFGYSPEFNGRSKTEMSQTRQIPFSELKKAYVSGDFGKACQMATNVKCSNYKEADEYQFTILPKLRNWVYGELRAEFYQARNRQDVQAMYDAYQKLQERYQYIFDKEIKIKADKLLRSARQEMEKIIQNQRQNGYTSQTY